MELVYLDHSSTTPLDPAAAEAMRPFWADQFANPASVHEPGRRARRALEAAREEIADLLGADYDEIVFTSGATEANNLAILGLCPDPPGTVFSTPIEHPSVAGPVQELARRGWTVRHPSIDLEGVVIKESARLADVQLATCMLVNHETGSLQPVAELAAQALAAGVPFHCDAVQAAGKIPLSFRSLGVASLSVSAHKFNGPKGIGALILRRDAPLKPIFKGGHQQDGRRPGTESPALAVGMAAALRAAGRQMDARHAKVAQLQQLLLDLLRESCPPCQLNGAEGRSIPHILNLAFPGCRSDALLLKLDQCGVACSAGSACTSGSMLPSPTLLAMNLPRDRVVSSIRFSLSHTLSETQVTAAAERIAKSVTELRNQDM